MFELDKMNEGEWWCVEQTFFYQSYHKMAIFKPKNAPTFLLNNIFWGNEQF